MSSFHHSIDLFSARSASIGCLFTYVDFLLNPLVLGKLATELNEEYKRFVCSDAAEKTDSDSKLKGTPRRRRSRV